MTKTHLALTSLVAALPAAFLAYLLVAALLSGAEQLGGLLMGLVIATLLCAVVVALMPVGIFVLGPKAGAAAPRKTEKKAAVEEFETDESTEPVDEIGDEQSVLVEDTTVDEDLYVEEAADETADDFLADFVEEEEPPKKKKK